VWGGHRTEWKSEVGHEQKKVENHWPREQSVCVNSGSIKGDCEPLLSAGLSKWIACENDPFQLWK
jgi:hypothetical protein